VAYGPRRVLISFFSLNRQPFRFDKSMTMIKSTAQSITETVEDRTIAMRFSASSATYDRSAKAQRIAAERLMEMIASVPSCERILETGCGTGNLTKKLATMFPDAAIDAFDISEMMIERARLRCAGHRKVKFAVRNLQHIPEVAPYPLVTSCSSLHWAASISEAMKKLSRLLAPNGKLIAQLMIEGTLEELRNARMRAAPGKPPLGRLPRMDEVATALSEAGLRIAKQTEERIVVAYSSPAELLAGIHEQGVTGGSVSRSTAPLTRSELRRLAEEYEASYRSENNEVYATYRAAYFVAERP
jgi:malonyl-CoA O-methyltransferase